MTPTNEKAFGQKVYINTFGQRNVKCRGCTAFVRLSEAWASGDFQYHKACLPQKRREEVRLAEEKQLFNNN